MNVKATPKKKAAVKAKTAKPAPRKEAGKTAVKAAREKKTQAPPAKTSSAAGRATKAPASRAPGAARVPRRAAKAAPKKPAFRLGKRDLEMFRNLLLEKQREFTEAYKVSKGDSRRNLDNGTEDYIDYAVSSYAKEFLLSLSELDRKQLLLVQEALRRIERGGYGLCLQCNNEIPRKRLEVAPWVRHCVRCQELEERGLLPHFPYPAEGEELVEDGLRIDEHDDYEAPLPREEPEEHPESEEEEEDEEIASEDSLVVEGEEE